ncbi:MAG: phosphatase PAP2 family protein [Candidatus Cloacimonas sp.]|jgi:membrane-associated PAP2 superfamily phosphatase|nr:phosphatase PAP2 family protein [Candidatus Cloacimonas sp.]
MINSNITEMAVRKSRHFLLTWDFILPLLILAWGTYIFRSSNLDIKIQSHYFSPLSGWAFENSPISKFIYHYGNIPALIISIGSLVLFILGYSRIKYLPFRKITIYLVLAMLIGPGIIVNSILKDNWGRPRPRDVVEFGGNYAYEEPLTYDVSSPGKSFPCGHATTGFYFFALAFVLRKKSHLLSSGVFFLAAVWGSIIGWVRVGQGGHFASDVLWAGVLVYLSCYFLYRAMGLHKQLYYEPDATKLPKKLKLHQKLLLGLVGLLIVVGVMLATPYSARKDVFISKELDGKALHLVYVDLPQAVMIVEYSNTSKFTFSANGFGFPGSKLKSDQAYPDNGFSFRQQRKGYFTELSCNANLLLDSLQVKQLNISLQQGELDLSLPCSFADTLYISPLTKVLAKPVGITLIPAQNDLGKRIWLDVPILKVRKRV